MNPRDRFAGPSIYLSTEDRAELEAILRDKQDMLPHRHMSINPDSNRADRRRVFKIRGTPPAGVLGGNQRQRVLAWKRNHSSKV